MFFSLENCTQGSHLPIKGPLGSPTRFFLESFRVALGFAGHQDGPKDGPKELCGVDLSTCFNCLSLSLALA